MEENNQGAYPKPAVSYPFQGRREEAKPYQGEEKDHPEVLEFLRRWFNRDEGPVMRD
ncbi:MAG: hypothetical protein HYW25_05640 [Candidatus Aenigmarchaeota archaeon]|nr:hypothetical protein [Candidatus Aenigmarchaeota archaeon]